MRQGLQQRTSESQTRANQNGDQASRQTKVLHQRLCKRGRMARQQSVNGVNARNRNGRVAKQTQPEESDKRGKGKTPLQRWMSENRHFTSDKDW